MTRNATFADDVTHTNKNGVSPNAAIPDSAASTKKWIEYSKLMDLVNQELPDAKSNLLKNPIHPIFQKRNWHDPAQDAWPQLQPALRLASKFVGEDEMLAFWYHLVWGRQKMQDASEKFGYSLERFSAEGPPLNTTQEQQISLWLREFGEKQQSLLFSFKEGVRLGNSIRTSARNIIVELEWEFLEILRDHGSGKKILSETQLLRVNLLIAAILLHELGHAVHMSSGCSRYEPYYDNHMLAEVGHAWACYAFGGAITPIRMPTKDEPNDVGGFWVATPPSPWQRGPLSKHWPACRPPPPVLGDLPKSATFWVLANEYIQRVQTEDFWEKDIKAYGVRALHVPPTDRIHDGQLSLSHNWTAKVTMSRGPNDVMDLEDCSSRNGADTERYNL